MIFEEERPFPHPLNLMLVLPTAIKPHPQFIPQPEAFKDGVLLADLRHVFEHGEVIETYPDDVRGLLYAQLLDPVMPIHIVVEETPDEGVIITAYIPDKRRWIRDRKRRK